MSMIRLFSAALKLSCVFLLSIILFSSCRKEEKFPIEPVLTSISIDQYEKNSFHIITGYTDGDGDLGLSDADTLAPYDKDRDRKSTRLNSSHVKISYAVFCLKKKKKQYIIS